MLLISSITALFVIAAIGAGVYWWRRRRRASRMISLVALVRETVMFDPAVLARTAGRVWDADLGDGNTEGEDGFVVGAGPLNTIVHDNQVFLINSMPCPYVDDPEAVSESIVDLRLRKLFREHRAWFSCDALEIVRHTSDAEVTATYHRLAKLFAEFLDENCLLIYIPDTSRAYCINDETHRALESDDPLAALEATLTAPIFAVPDDDAAMQAAVAQARSQWPRFVAAYEAGAGKNFSVKAPVSYGDVTEFIWIAVTALEGDQIFGTLGNEPADLGPLRLGSKVCVPLAELNDWCYVDPRHDLQGGFTIKVVHEASRRAERA